MPAVNIFTEDILAAVRERLYRIEEEDEISPKSFAEAGLVPTAAAFGEAEFMPSPALALMGASIVEEFPEFEHLHEVRIAYDWKKKGGRSGGADKLGRCTKASGLLAAHGDAAFYIWLAADHIAAYALDRQQVRAALYHELAHIGYQEADSESEEEDGNGGVYRVVAHDFEGFTGEIERFGLWRSPLRRVQQTIDNLHQSGLPGFGMPY